ncbi:serine aminopeptidase domain-containing protein [Mycolicibacterium mengxianglii]|uniref:serine aminopeptidase domain-containing protein n=1 Tax=Mycolicibacterium mengxianglii TaxID=2736649 RepID=UPI0018EED543|nr:alpha/beta hydrolase [Mycolicibacterium mengxianglii]
MRYVHRFKVVVTVLLCGLVFPAVTACHSTPEPSAYDYVRVFVHGQGVLGVSAKYTDPTRIAVFFHGLDQTEKVLLDDAHRPLVDTLVNAGFAVVAGDAGGNAFGNSDSQSDYLGLIEFAQAHYGGPLPMYFIAESMGAAAATIIYATTPDLNVRGLAGISPALDYQSVPDGLQPAITAAYAPRSPESANPMTIAPKLLAGKHFRFWASDTDTMVPAALNATAFQRKFGAVADVTVETCTGDHADPSCMPAEPILDWLNRL